MTFDYRSRRAWLVGLALGLGAVIGDHAKSFLKRRIGILPGGPWWPYDQLDFVAGSLVATLPIVGWIGWGRAAVIAVFVLIVHPLGNRISHYIGLRRVPW